MTVNPVFLAMQKNMQHKESNQLQNSWKNEVKSLFPVTISPGFYLAPKKRKLPKTTQEKMK